MAAPFMLNITCFGPWERKPAARPVPAIPSDGTPSEAKVSVRPACFGFVAHPHLKKSIPAKAAHFKLGAVLDEIAADRASFGLGGEPFLPPGYELAILSVGGVSVFGADTDIFIGTHDNIVKMKAGQPVNGGPTSEAKWAEETPSEAKVSPNPPATHEIFVEFVQPRGESPVFDDRSILAKGNWASGGDRFGQLVFARRNCTSLEAPGAIIFPSQGPAQGVAAEP
jgi:hypothetical protein